MSLSIKRRRYLNIAFWMVCECENSTADLVLMTFRKWFELGSLRSSFSVPASYVISLL